MPNLPQAEQLRLAAHVGADPAKIKSLSIADKAKWLKWLAEELAHALGTLPAIPTPPAARAALAAGVADPAGGRLAAMNGLHSAIAASQNIADVIHAGVAVIENGVSPP
jgi:hypothetical protein